MLDEVMECEILNITPGTVVKMIEEGKMIEARFDNDTIYLNGNYIDTIQFKEEQQ